MLHRDVQNLYVPRLQKTHNIQKNTHTKKKTDIKHTHSISLIDYFIKIITYR